MTRAERYAHFASSPGRAWMARPDSARPTLAAIEEAACTACGVTGSEIRGPERHGYVNRARQVRAMLAMALGDGRWTYEELGREWGMAHNSICKQHQAAKRLCEAPEWAAVYRRALDLVIQGLGSGLS